MKGVGGYESGIPEIKFGSPGGSNTIVKYSIGTSVVTKTPRYMYTGGYAFSVPGGGPGLGISLSFFNNDAFAGYAGSTLTGEVVFGTQSPGDYAFILHDKPI